MKIEVTGCNDCPFYNVDDNVRYCSLDEKFTAYRGLRTIEFDSTKFEPITPDWCFLKKESITVEIK